MVGDQSAFLNTVDIIKVLGLNNSPQEVQSKALFDAQMVVLDDFFDNVMPSVLSPEDLEVFMQEIDKIKNVEQKEAVSYFDQMIIDLFNKYPNLLPSFIDRINEYKTVIMQERVKFFTDEGQFNQKQIEEAQQYLQAQDWENLYNLIVSMY